MDFEDLEPRSKVKKPKPLDDMLFAGGKPNVKLLGSARRGLPRGHRRTRNHRIRGNPALRWQPNA